MHDPKTITTTPKQLTVAKTEQRYYLVRESDKLAALTRILEVEHLPRPLFLHAPELARLIWQRHCWHGVLQAEALHGDLAQNARETVLGQVPTRKHYPVW